MKKLVIVESPSKAKTINKYLGKDYTVVASVGHVRDLPKSNKDAVDIKAGFVPKYVVDPRKKDVIEDIKEKAKKSEEVILATDPDREGESIAWHIKEAVGLKNPKRVVFHEITKSAILEALEHPREIDDKLREAQEARRVLDRLFGYDLSGLLWKKLRYGLSAGRVQSPALRILAEREREIQAFVSTPYWVIKGEFKTKKGEKFSMECEEQPEDQKTADEIVSKAKENKWSVVGVQNTEVKRQPKPPFTTSTLQQAASSRLGYSPSRTMLIAQKLYETGHITYMRTDSVNLSKEAIAGANIIITSKYGEKYANPRIFKTSSKNAQEAHEAIRPTDMGAVHDGHTPEQKKLYDLIWSRTVASQMTDALMARTKITANIDAKDIPNFSANGSRIIFDGWLKADPDSSGEEVLLPNIDESSELTLENIESIQKFTEPPSRYTEAGLVKELEKRGIGRPSTYASIIKTIQDRHYVEKENRSLKPTDTGMVVSGFLEDHFAKYISDTFTALMEDELDEIALGKREYVQTLKDFYTSFSKDVASKKDIEKISELGDADAKFKCPICSSPMKIKLGRGGKFLSCARFPECQGALTIDGIEIKKDEPLGKDPVTDLPIFTKIGRFGPYVQMGNKETLAKGKKPKMASIPKEKDPSTVSIEDALKYLSLPRELGNHPDTGKPISAGIGRFGPYVVHERDFRSIKQDDPYTITFERALSILSEPKKVRAGRKKV